MAAVLTAGGFLALTVLDLAGHPAPPVMVDGVRALLGATMILLGARHAAVTLSSKDVP